MNGKTIEDTTDTKNNRKWKIVFLAWLVFIVIDFLITGIFLVILNYLFVEIGRSSGGGGGLPVPKFERAIGSIVLSGYKFIFVPFYWFVLFFIARRNKSILSTALGKTVFTTVCCFIVAFLIPEVITQFFEPGNHAFFTNLVFEPRESAFIFYSSLFSAAVSAALWHYCTKKIWRE